jgi:Crinkler effector protein N-terminal domain
MVKRVWIQLYIGDEKSGKAFKIEVNDNDDIDDLSEAAKKKCRTALEHCDAARLDVFKAGTKYPPEEKDKLSPGKTVPLDTTDEMALLVVAPPMKAPEPGKNLFCCFHGCIYEWTARSF